MRLYWVIPFNVFTFSNVWARFNGIKNSSQSWKVFTPKYENRENKQAETQKKYRARKKEQESVSAENHKETIAARRAANRVRAKRFRERQNISKLYENDVAVRHLALSLTETYTIYCKEQQKGTFSFEMVFQQINNIWCKFFFSPDVHSYWNFKEQRPEHIKCINDVPKNMYMCQYHANFNEAVTALNKAVPNIPSYNDGFIHKFLCEVSSSDCWLLKCRNCSGISLIKLQDLIGEMAFDSKVEWMVWKWNTQTKTIETYKKTG